MDTRCKLGEHCGLTLTSNLGGCTGRFLFMIFERELDLLFVGPSSENARSSDCAVAIPQEIDGNGQAQAAKPPNLAIHWQTQTAAQPGAHQDCSGMVCITVLRLDHHLVCDAVARCK